MRALPFYSRCDKEIRNSKIVGMRIFEKDIGEE